jgi:hypothetical protein
MRSGLLDLLPETAQDATTRRTLSDTLRDLDRQTLLEQIAELEGPNRKPSRDDAAEREALARATASLLSGEPLRILRVLDSDEALHRSLAPHLITLLGDDRVARPVAHALADIAASIAGQLVDVIGDSHATLSVRVRAARVLGQAGTVRAVAGLCDALEADAFEVRRAAALALSYTLSRRTSLAPERERILEIVRWEVRGGIRDDRHLDHVFTLLCLTLPPEPLDLARCALRSNDPSLRGTALEYLHVALPDDIRKRIAQFVGAPTDTSPRRGRKEVLDELLRTARRARPAEVAP